MQECGPAGGEEPNPEREIGQVERGGIERQMDPIGDCATRESGRLDESLDEVAEPSSESSTESDRGRAGVCARGNEREHDNTDALKQCDEGRMAGAKAEGHAGVLDKPKRQEPTKRHDGAVGRQANQCPHSAGEIDREGKQCRAEPHPRADGDAPGLTIMRQEVRAPVFGSTVGTGMSREVAF